MKRPLLLVVAVFLLFGHLRFRFAGGSFPLLAPARHPFVVDGSAAVVAAILAGILQIRSRSTPPRAGFLWGSSPASTASCAAVPPV